MYHWTEIAVIFVAREMFKRRYMYKAQKYGFLHVERESDAQDVSTRVKRQFYSQEHVQKSMFFRGVYSVVRRLVRKCIAKRNGFLQLGSPLCRSFAAAL